MIRNFTPHVITLISECSEYPEQQTPVLTVFPSEGTIRVSQEIRELPDLPGGIPVVECDYGPAEGVPENLAADDYLVVSSLCVESLLHYDNLKGRILTPDTGPGSVVRDSEGKILGIRRFILH
jgi:hypothetical protein